MKLKKNAYATAFFYFHNTHQRKNKIFFSKIYKFYLMSMKIYFYTIIVLKDLIKNHINSKTLNNKTWEL